MEERVTVALLLLLTISITAYHITDKHLLDLSSYQELLGARNFVEGKELSTSMLNRLTAAVYSFFSTGELNSSLLLTIAKVIPILLSLLSVVAFYFMLKQMLSPLASFAGAVFLLSSQAFLLKMSSGIYTHDSLGMCLFILACSSLFIFKLKKNYLLLILSSALFLLSSFGWDAGWVMPAAVTLSLLAEFIFQREKEYSSLAAVALASLISYLTTSPAIFSKTLTLNPLSLPTLPLLIIGAALLLAKAAGRYKCKGRFEFFTASIFIISVLLSNFDAFPASFGIALFSAFSINELLNLKEEKAVLAVFSLILLFVSFEFTKTFMKFEQSIIVSLFIAASSVFIVSLYRDRRINVYITFSLILLLLFSSVGVAALTQLRLSDVVGEQVDEMMEWAKELPEANFWAFRITPLLEFTSGKQGYGNDTEFAQFILSNQSVEFLKERNITHLVVDASMFDNIEMIKTIANNTKVRIDSFRLYGTQVDQNRNYYAVFVTADGKAAFVQYDPLTGNLLEGDVVIYMGEGRRTVPLKKFLRVGSYRLIYPQDNYRVNLFLLFFENVDGLKEVYTSETGEMKVFEVLG